MSTEQQRRVLIVDDSAIMLEVAKGALEEAGFAVVTATNLAELEANEGIQADLILMDVNMPELFGDDVAMVLREVRGVDSLIYLWSSLDTEELAERAREAELDGYLSKQVGVEELVKHVKEILEA